MITRRKRTITRVSIGITFALASAAAATAPGHAEDSTHDALIEAAGKAEAWLNYIDLEKLRSERDLESAIERSKECVNAASRAIAGGVAKTTWIRVDDNKAYADRKQEQPPSHGVVYFARLGEVSARCIAVHGKARLIPTIWELDAALSRVDAIRKSKKPDSSDAVLAEMAYRNCVGGVERSLALGAAPTDVIRVGDLSLQLKDVVEHGCGLVKQVKQEAANAAEAAEEAKFAPYKKALRKDKWRVFVDYKMINFRVYGRGGKELRTPTDLAGAGVWFEILNSGSRYHWAMRRFKFRKNKLVSTKKITGKGPQPPSRAYR